MPFRTSSLHLPPYSLHFPPLYSTSLHLGTGSPPRVRPPHPTAAVRFPTTVGFRLPYATTAVRFPTTVGFRLPYATTAARFPTTVGVRIDEQLARLPTVAGQHHVR